MNYRNLGNSGAIVSSLCLGTMTFGKEADEATSHLILDTYAAAGGTFIDTADVYGSVRQSCDHADRFDLQGVPVLAPPVLGLPVGSGQQ